ncbi:mannose-1-phosphate guanylyltransferase/mannose-6-phosphate isomerase [Thiorhodococcus mannitoliphagus]|uniref:mannose-1-phosphate guanylyltransferase n=1 Tax=Thiorhodococcus mannitoliphagus TaxID=329406 RepID=A0A6P1DS48_9GAMM|nr:mannose-1-phosphate guanylyltransferase/mannose-6-phosphate isomerase [Thiorhodococcus mannitoliphagus]NEX19751.1 mannose-1-phosphate guanylyltransferase/mannose-6-phosphate isomerase [Thiorhodococcus mannitoliphagus]
MSLQPVILSGGSGTRLWPLSRQAYPKQFLPLTSDYTMLQETVRRLDGLTEEHPREAIGQLDPLVVCNEAHRFLVAEQFRVIGRDAARILLEPAGRNTAPALTLAAKVATESGEDPVLLVMPADHTIRDEEAFRAAVADAYLIAREGAVVTFGIVPGKPETGYGYIRQGAAYPMAGLANQAFALDEFVEKPDIPTAEAYLASGDYAWNSGIFVLKASVWLDLIERFRSDIVGAISDAFSSATLDGNFLRLDTDRFSACPSDSIDYAVMERLSSGKQASANLPTAVVIPLDVGWSDVGAWSALWEVRDQDAAGNVLDGDAFVHESADNLIVAQSRMVAAVGVSNLIVVETPDAVLVTTKDAAQDVKAVTQFLQSEQRDECMHHQRVHRPWGSYESIGRGDRYQVKRLVVHPGESLSSQMHHHRAEHWIVVSGTARVTCGDSSFLLTENQSAYIPVGSTHRLENPGSIPLEVIEVQSGSYLGEDDIVRFEDRYNREPAEKR